MVLKTEGKKLPNYISEPLEGIFQVRIVRNRKVAARTFSRCDYGNRAKALAEAMVWRNLQLNEVLPSQYDLGFRKFTNASKLSGLPVGVTTYVEKTRGKEYLIFTAKWNKDGKQRSTSFRVGEVGLFTSADERHAVNTAIAFRERWEYCKLYGYKFDEYMKDWRERVRYPFFPHRENLEPIKKDK